MQYGLRAALVIPLTGGEGGDLGPSAQPLYAGPAVHARRDRLRTAAGRPAVAGRGKGAPGRRRDPPAHAAGAIDRQLPTAIAVLEGPEYRYALADPTYQAVTGLSEQQLLGRTVAEALPWGKDDIYPLLHRTYGQGEVVPLSSERVPGVVGAGTRGDPLERRLCALAGPGRGGGGHPGDGQRGDRLCADVAPAGGGAWHRLRRSEATHRAIARNFPNGAIYVFDRDLRYLVAEGELLPVFGQTPATIEGKTISALFDPATVQTIEPRYRRTLAGEFAALRDILRGALWGSPPVGGLPPDP